jgi:hypothetical protein
MEVAVGSLAVKQALGPLLNGYAGFAPPAVNVTVLPSKLFDGVCSQGLTVRNNPLSIVSGVHAILVAFSP